MPQAHHVIRPRHLTALLLTGITLFHLWYVGANILDLAPDEAHYWEWSRRLDWSYYSKGPLVAYLIAATTRLGGDTPFFVRLPAVLLALGTTILTYQITHKLFARERAAFLAVLLMTACPLYAAGSVLMTIDAPFVFFWALALYSLLAALEAARGPARAWWTLFGAAVGLGFLAKYTMASFLPCLAIYCLTSAVARTRCISKAPCLALLLAGLVSTPVVVWNAEHDWVSFRHVTALAGLAGREPSFALTTFAEFLGSQLGVVSPLLFCAGAIAVARSGRLGFREQRDAHRVLFAFSAPPFLFFLLWSLHQKVEANWAAPAYIAAAVATGAWADELLARLSDRPQRRRLIGTILVVLLPGWLTIAVAHFPGILPTLGIPLPPNANPTARLMGWNELGIAAGRLLGTDPAKETFLLSESYQIASELAFYVPSQPLVYNVNLGRRMNQYDIWGGLDQRRGQDALYVTGGDWETPHPLHVACEAMSKVQVVHVSRHGQPIRSFSIFRCQQYRGLPNSPSTETY